MTKERAKATIQKAVKNELPNESQAVRDFIVKDILDMFLLLEQTEGDRYTSKENLDFSIDATLYDGYLSDLIAEAKQETGER